MIVDLSNYQPNLVSKIQETGQGRVLSALENYLQEFLMEISLLPNCAQTFEQKSDDFRLNVNGDTVILTKNDAQ